MEQQEKLSKFRTAIFSEIDEQVKALSQSAEESVNEALKKNKEALLQRSSEDVQKKIDDIRRDSKRSVAKFSLESRRSVLECRSRMADQIFSAVAERLSSFHASKEYESFLLKQIRSFAESQPLRDVVLFVGSQDFALAEKIKKAYGLPCQVREEASITLGGFWVQDEAEGAFFDETLARRLSAQKAYFIEHSGLDL